MRRVRFRDPPCRHLQNCRCCSSPGRRQQCFEADATRRSPINGRTSGIPNRRLGLRRECRDQRNARCRGHRNSPPKLHPPIRLCHAHRAATGRGHPCPLRRRWRRRGACGEVIVLDVRDDECPSPLRRRARAAKAFRPLVSVTMPEYGARVPLIALQLPCQSASYRRGWRPLT